MIIQLCGLSGAGKSTLSAMVKKKLQEKGIPVEIIDGDDYRQALCKGLGFSKADRVENMQRLGFVASKLSAHGIVVIISAINPYQEVRAILSSQYSDVHTVFIDCALPTVIKRDTKGLYRKALLPDGHPEKINNMTGINDPFEVPAAPDLHINTGIATADSCTAALVTYILKRVPSRAKARMLSALLTEQ